MDPKRSTTSSARAKTRRWRYVPFLGGGAMILLPMVLTAWTASAVPESPREHPNGARGAFAFHYGPELTPERLAWYSRFELLVTHDPLPPQQVLQLRAAGTKLLFYEWTVAFYETRASSWQRSLIAEGTSNLLHDTPLKGGVGSRDARAWYFDPAADAHAAARATDLVRRLTETGYDGVFFDTTGVESVHPVARAEYERRHPGLPYDAAFARVLVELRKMRPDVVLFTNQGYRHAKHYLPHVDWDLTESLVTTADGGTHRLRRWSDAGAPWSAVGFVMQQMIEPVMQRHPKVRFGHLNYSDGSSHVARLAVAAARLFGGDAFVVSDDLQNEIDEVYFLDLGRTTAPRVDWEGGTGAHRTFERGLVVVTSSDEAVRIPVEAALRDVFSRERFCAGTVSIPPASDGPRAYFFEVIADCEGSA